MPIIQSVERALKILDLFDEFEPELKITEISDKMELNKSTVHSLLKTLEKHKYIDQNPENGKYKLGLKLIERGNCVVSTIDIRQVARTYLLDLAKRTGQTVHLGILNGKEGVYIDKIEGESAIIRFSKIGKGFPLHATAIGKVLLAFQEPKETNLLLSNYNFTEQTEYSITNQGEFLAQIEKVHQQGYAIDNQENELGVRCIAAPLLNFENKVLAGISISTLISQVNDEKLGKYIKLLKQTSLEISKKLGYRLY
ncbi:IclR family transcriptional regulator [Caldifermentibacillus hisashii]|uniref:IclR family transcriptional regulator n=1 Tax=Caldifermentibacillus hisashii TaxID=996558 RepID=UPI002E0A0CC7|nr:IclR family transcriptional regulator [Caldifermentibacillus hisashii]